MAETRSATVFFQLPVWVIGSPSARVNEIVRAVDPHGVNGVLLFTRKSLAQRHLEADSRLAGKVLWMVFDQWHFFGLLVLLEKVGTEYFVIDPVPALTGTSMSVRHAVPIAGLRAYVEQLVL